MESETKKDYQSLMILDRLRTISKQMTMMWIVFLFVLLLGTSINSLEDCSFKYFLSGGMVVHNILFLLVLANLWKEKKVCIHTLAMIQKNGGSPECDDSEDKEQE